MTGHEERSVIFAKQAVALGRLRKQAEFKKRFGRELEGRKDSKKSIFAIKEKGTGRQNLTDIRGINGVGKKAHPRFTKSRGETGNAEEVL